MARGGEQHVVWLDVPVHDAALVQVLQGEDHGGEVEDSLMLWETAIHAEEGLEVAANHVLHHHEHVVGRLQTIEEGNTELRLSKCSCVSLRYHLVSCHHISLRKNEIRDRSYLVNHVLLHHHRLLHHLHRQLSLLLALPVAKEDLAKGASRDWLQDLKVFD